MATAAAPRADEAQSVSLQSIPIPLPTITGINLARLYRAHVESTDYRSPERTAFVEAASHRCACKKIAESVAALEHRTPAEVADRIYNCFSAQELVDQGLSEDLALRLFETGWSGGRPTYFVREPLFLLAAPATIIRKWTAVPAPIDECRPVLEAGAATEPAALAAALSTQPAAAARDAVQAALDVLGRASSDWRNNGSCESGSLHWPVSVNLARRALREALETLEPVRWSPSEQPRAEEDARAGIAWFNGLSPAERRYWLETADSAVPAAAWDRYKAGVSVPA